MTPFTVTAKVGDKDIILETGKVAKQAHGAIWTRMGESIVLVTVVSANEKKEGIDFFPLTVDYQEKLFAAAVLRRSFVAASVAAVETLAARLADEGAGDVPAALQAYERARIPRANAIVRQSRRVGEVEVLVNVGDQVKAAGRDD